MRRGGRAAGRIAGLLLLAGGAPGRGEEAAFSTIEFSVPRGRESLVVRLRSPARLHPRPLLLLNFATDRGLALDDPLFGEPVRHFLAAGHRAATFDLPAHGDRVDARGRNIEGLQARWSAGDDPFAGFVEDGRAVIDACVARGVARHGAVAVSGTSRAGYCALRLAAADGRVGAVAGLAPVTDWRELREFAAVREDPGLASLVLDRFAGALAGRPVYLALGNADRRVGTPAFTRLVDALAREEARLGLTVSRLRLLVVDDSPGHTLDRKWRADAAEFLLRHLGEAAGGRPDSP